MVGPLRTKQSTREALRRIEKELEKYADAIGLDERDEAPIRLESARLLEAAKSIVEAVREKDPAGRAVFLHWAAKQVTRAIQDKQPLYELRQEAARPSGDKRKSAEKAPAKPNTGGDLDAVPYGC